MTFWQIGMLWITKIIKTRLEVMQGIPHSWTSLLFEMRLLLRSRETSALDCLKLWSVPYTIIDVQQTGIGINRMRSPLANLIQRIWALKTKADLTTI